MTASRNLGSTIAYGGDFNPEHWPAEIVPEDLRLMKEAGVTLVSVGIFGWAVAEPRPGEYDFTYYRSILDQLHAHGIGVSLATMTASPPPWLTHRHPEVLPVRADGIRMWPGSRQHYCPSSPVLREAVAGFVTALVAELGDHPTLRLWHVNNEYGCHTKSCWCDVSADAFRSWLRERYGTVDELNRAWTTTFWSQGYSDFAEVLPPRVAPTYPNSAQQLDFARWTSEELQSLMRVETEILRRGTPDVPITTNFAAIMPVLDLWSWAKDLDIVSFDSYPDPADPMAYQGAAFDYDVVRGLHEGRPWMLLEQAPSAVNWRARNAPKPPGRVRLGSWQAVAHGADAVMFFQWRASPGGAEKFHSAMVGHTGAESRVFREVAALGAELAAHDEAAGLETRSDVGILLDWESWWAGELDSHPTTELRLREQMVEWHSSCAALGLSVDVVHPLADLSRFRLLIAPSLYLVRSEAGEALTRWVDAGGVLIVGAFAGVADESDRVHPGGAPGPLRRALGLTVQEWWPLQADDAVHVTVGAAEAGATTLLEDVVVHTATTLGEFVDGPLGGRPAVLCNAAGTGEGIYVAARLDARGRREVLHRAVDSAGVRPLLGGLPERVEVVRRGEGDEALLFILNHGTDSVTVEVPAGLHDLLDGGASTSGRLLLDGHGVALLRGAR